MRVSRNEVDAGNNARVGTGARRIKDLDSVKLGLLCNTVGLGADSSSDVGTVAVAISGGTITSIVGQVGSTALEVRVSSVDTSVDDVSFVELAFMSGTNVPIRTYAQVLAPAVSSYL